MKLRAVKFIHAVAAMLFLLGAAAPACYGQENCSMPCCRHKTPPASSHADAAPTKPCCSQTADSSPGAGCRYDRTHLAFDPGPAAASTALAATASIIPHDPIELPLSPRMVIPTTSGLFKTPLFLRTQTLLI
jgi:hypothetical protein